MATEKKWYAVYTKPRWEKKVVSLLTRRNIENFCPLNKVERKWADRKKVVEEPLFASYVFVYASEAEHLTIKQTDGIVTFVYWLGTPAVIKNEEINAIKQFVSEHSNVKLEKTDVKINDHVRLNGGLFGQQEGKVVEVRNRTIKVFLPTLGYTMIADLVNDEVEVHYMRQPANASSPLYNAKAV